MGRMAHVALCTQGQCSARALPVLQFVHCVLICYLLFCEQGPIVSVPHHLKLEEAWQDGTRSMELEAGHSGQVHVTSPSVLSPTLCSFTESSSFPVQGSKKLRSGNETFRCQKGQASSSDTCSCPPFPFYLYQTSDKP